MDDLINEPLAREFLELGDLIAEALGGEANVPPEISDRLTGLYNSIIAWEKELKASLTHTDGA
jgi:hypothetical protein